MKKDTPEKITYRLSHAASMYRREFRKRRTRGFNSKGGDTRDSFPGYKTLYAPGQFGFINRDSSEVTINFINAIRLHLPKSRVLISFRQCDSMDISGALLLFSHISKCIQEYGIGRIKTSSSGINSPVKDLLTLTGIAQLNYTTSIRLAGHELPILEGQNLQFVDEIIKFVSDTAFDGSIPPEREQLLYAATTEAMNNVQKHAYQSGEKKWWLVLSCAKNYLYIAILDHGVGIPATLPNQPYYKKLISLFPLTNDLDSERVKLAMKAHVTSTKDTGRGRGSRDIKDLISKSLRSESNLRVVSGKGVYLLDQKRGKVKEISDDLPIRLQGTYIQWFFKLGNENE